MKNTFVISCPIDTYSGYGARSRDLVKSIIELNKYDVKIMSQRWGATPFGFIEDNPEWAFLQDHLLKDNNIQSKPDIWAQITVPNEFSPVGNYNIGITAGIETTMCSAPWIEGMNRMDINLVSTQHSKDVFVNTKFDQMDKKTNQKINTLTITKPIEVLLEGANLDVYKPLKQKEIKNLELFKDIDSIPEDFSFLVVGHWMQGVFGEDRKNIGLTLKSFYETFKNKKKKPALIIKTSTVSSSHMDRREIMKRIASIRNVCNGNLPNVYLLHGNFSNEEMNELYNHPKVKAMVSHTKGEGFGRPLLEFSLSNKPIICSGWSGQIDFLKNDRSCLIGGKLTKVHPSAVVDGVILPEAQWFAPDPNHIHNSYKELYSNYKPWAVKGKKQGYYSRTYFAFENMKAKIGEILESNINLPVQIPVQLPKLNLPKLKKV